MLVVDVDALCKLAHWNILPILPDLTGYVWGEIGTVSSLIHRAKRAISAPDGEIFHSSDAARVAVDAILRMGDLEATSPEILDALSGSNQIDPGEAVLLASIADDPNGRFLTGDKRALRALSGLGCAPRFAGKILLVEHILWDSLESKGRDWVLQNVCPFRNIDKAITMILGSRCDASVANLTDGIRSYINEIAALHNPSLLVNRSGNMA